MKFSTFLLFFILLFGVSVTAQNLLTNGNFEGGGNGTGFNISNPNYIEISAPFLGTTVPGNFGFSANPQPLNTSKFISGGDHTTGTGLMLAVDGTLAALQQRLWRAGSTAGGVCGLTIGKSYQFSYWIKSISTEVTNAATSADIGVQFTNVSTSALVSGTALAPLPAAGWKKVVYSFVASASCVNIEIYNNNTSNLGNDFALDDFSVFVPLSATYSTVSSTCFGANNGSITAYASNGVTPYVLYSITGPTPQSNTSGYFSGLTNGIYSLTITDANSATTTVNGISVAQPANLVTPFDSAICAGSSRTLTVSGGTGYLWTASPADPSLTQPTSATPSVSPTVPTTYTVTSTNNLPRELVFNGNFSAGNRGFVTDYQYLTPSNPSGATRSYGIVTNPSVWWNALSSCGDHTSTTGNMMVVNGSDSNAGNDKLWNQKIPVNASQSYTFSFWVQSLSAANPAAIEATINGISVGSITALGTISCGNWRQFSVIWNSAASSFADILLYNRNVNTSGNDFAIDDVSFTTLVTCNLSRSVTLTPVAPATATISGSANGCPGYTSVISVSGTPNATVVIQSVDGTVTSSPITLSAAGVGSWTTPAINDTTIFNVVSVNTAISGCITNPTGASVTITIVLNGCAQTGINGAINNPASIDASCTTGQCRTLTASYTDLKDTSSYVVTSIPYCPLPYDDPSYTQVSLTDDDIWTPPVNLPFNFCFFGNNYNKVQIGSNGVVTFDVTNSTAPGGCTYIFSNTIPSTSFPITLRNSIYGVLQDIDVSLSYSPSSARFSYKLLDTGANAYPCRKLVVNFYNMGQWGCGAAPGLQTYQMVLYEVSNVIEVNVLHRQPCASGAANNRGVIGIQNAAGTLGYTPTNRNTGTWTADQESWRFTPNGASIATFGWFQGTTPIPYDPITKVATVCPTVTTTYTASTTYTTCGGVPIVKAKDITVVVNNDPIATQNPNDLTDCDGVFNLTLNTATVLGTLPAGDYDIKYHLTPLEAQSASNPIPFSSTFPSAGGQTIYMSIANIPTNCKYTKQFNLIAVPLITPTFNQIGPFCIGENFTLPSASTNIPAITGNWSPAINNTATTLYTFTPDAAFTCAVPATMTVVINNTPTTPTFNAVAPVCAGSAIPALPTTSLNGISGSWTPPLNNTTTTTYTFAPNPGSCANTQTITITVNPAITPTFTQVAAICSGATLAALLTTSTNGIPGSWLPALNNTLTTVYTFTPNSGQCASTQVMTVTVNPLITPTFVQAGPFCIGETFSLPATSTNITAIAGTWSPAINNTTTTTYTFTPNNVLSPCAVAVDMTVVINNTPVTPNFAAVGPFCAGSIIPALPTTSLNGISGSWTPPLNNTTTTTYRFTPNAGSCATTQDIIVTINPAITPTFSQVAAICSGATLAPLPTTSTNGISGSWSPALNNTATTIYTFAPNPGQCTTTQTMTITVNPIVTPTFTQVAAICSGATLAALPTISVNGITGSWFPPLNNTLTTAYAFTPDFGQCASTQVMTITVNPFVTPTFVQIAPICSGDSFSLPTSSTNNPPISGNWSPALNNTATTIYTFTPDNGQCANRQTMTITVNPAITPTFTQVATICSGATLLPLPTTSTNGISGSWSPALNNTATTIYTFAPNSGQCANAQTMTITVNPAITPTFTQVAAICSGATLAPLPTTSTNGISGTWSPALNNTATTIYTFAPNPGQCTTTQTMSVTVNSLSTATVEIQNICAGLSAKVEAKPVPAGSYTYLWTVPAGVTNPGNVSNFQTSTAGNYSVIITNTTTGCVSTRASGTLTITPIATFQAISAPVCEGTSAKVEAFPSAGVATDYLFVWTVPSGAVNPGNTNTFTTSVAGNYSVIATSNATTCSSALASVVVQINPKPIVALPQNGFVCVDSNGVTIPGLGASFTLDTALSAVNYGFEWFTNGVSNGNTTSSLTVVVPGDYKVIVKNLTTLCTTTALATVVASLPPTSLLLTASNFFENNQTITVDVLPIGVYEYQIDNGTYQDSNVFTNLDSGVHAVRVRDKKACGSIGDSMMTIDYPHFFTPNGDGYNDKWNITDLKTNSAATTVIIYDRYGKLLKQISINGDGWDGTYNGTDLISDDYWFTIRYTEKGIEKEFKSHFSLKR